MYERESEIKLYIKEYESPRYRMGDRRKSDVYKKLSVLTPKTSLLDVSTGRGETLLIADDLGFDLAMGTEIVPDLIGERVVKAYAHELPFADGSFDWVTCFDVLEHLTEPDIVPALSEMWRVARLGVIVSASERPSVFGGRDLHISKRPAVKWQSLIKSVWGNCHRDGVAGGSPCFKGLK